MEKIDDPYVSSKALFQLDRLKDIQNNLPVIPTLLQVDPEAFCNDNCSFCSYRASNMYNTDMIQLLSPGEGELLDGNKPIGKPSRMSGWPLTMATLLPKQMKDVGIPAIEITGGGEPTLWPGFDALLESCIEHGLEVGLVTNGSQFYPSRALKMALAATDLEGWIRFSMDAATEETHQKIHRTANKDFPRRIKSIVSMVKAKKSTKSQVTIGVSFLVRPDNIQEVELACDMYGDMGIDYIRFTFQYDKDGRGGLTDEQYDSIIPLLKKCQKVYNTDKYKILFDTTRLWTYSQPNDDFSRCHIQKFVWAIGADAKVYPCCIMKYHPDYAWADLKEKTLAEIISDPVFNAKQDSLDVTKCRPCWMRTRNQAIDQAVTKPKHSNFL